MRATMGSVHNINPLGGGMEVLVKTEGQGWITLAKFLNYLTKNQAQGIRRDFATAGRAYLKRYQTLLWKGLMSEGSYLGVGWPPHSPNYNSPTGQLLYRKGVYQKALENMKVTQKRYSVHLFMNPGDANARSDGGATVAQYANVHEFGAISRGIPARPLWFPAFAKIEGGSSTTGYGGFQSRMQASIGKRLNKMGVQIKTVQR